LSYIPGKGHTGENQMADFAKEFAAGYQQTSKTKYKSKRKTD
jgi:hypothetical protein